MNNDITTPIDIELIIERRKRQWMKDAKQTVSIQERIATSVPWWLIIIATGLFALSASHTAGVFNQLSNIGYAGPFVVEFALLWAAFVRVGAKQDRAGISMALRGLEVLVFVMAVGANTIGAMSRVAELSGIDTFSFTKIVNQFGALPITTQAEILFVPLFGLFIPIGTWVVGEGLADLFLKQRRTGGLLEEKWREVEREEVRRAFYSELVRRGDTPLDARRQAESLSAGLTHGHSRTPKTINEPVQIKAIQETAKVPAVAVRRPVRATSSVDVRGQIRRHLETHEASRKLSARALSVLVTGSDRSRQVANEELQRYRDGNQ